MNQKVLILGSYGNFGSRIAKSLAQSGVSIVIAGRNRVAANSFKQQIQKEYPTAEVSVAIFDIKQALDKELERIKPSIVINTCGPFQDQDYSIPRICIERGIHYIDLADARNFVTDIIALDDLARAKNVMVISGASTVPALSSAVIEHFKERFSQITSLKYGISPGQKTTRGLATTQAVLSYVGKPLKPFVGTSKTTYGWQDIYRQSYPIIGYRWMANCDIPDLDLLPARYHIHKLTFSAGLEISFLHIGLWCLSWLVRVKIIKNLASYSQRFLTASHWFDRFGTDAGGMHMIFTGINEQGQPQEIKWFMIAKEGCGPQIPCVPAIVLCKKILAGTLNQPGARSCVGMVSLEEYKEALNGLNIQEIVE